MKNIYKDKEQKDAITDDFYRYLNELRRQEQELINAASQSWETKEERKRLLKEADKIRRRLINLVDYPIHGE